MPFASRRPLALATLALAICTIVGVLAGLPSSGRADVQSQADSLRGTVRAQTQQIGRTHASLVRAEQHLARLEARAERRQAAATDAQNRLVAARIHLAKLEDKAAAATTTLARNLVTTYETRPPDVVTVVMQAKGFSDLLERLDFYKRIARRNGDVLGATRTAKAAVAKQAVQLKSLRVKLSALARGAIADRNEANVLKTALLRREERQLDARAGARAKLASVQAKLRAIQRAQAAAARRAAVANGATAQAPTVSPGNASGAVAKVIAAANEIATTPYVWGGGHGGASGGYDCSGSVSYALAAAGLLSAPLDSTGFMSWGDAGPGQHITVYANASHAYMYVDGRRYDTSALSGGGTRWTSAARSNAGFVARHPPGL